MQIFIYNIFIAVFSITARLAAPFYKKAALWVEGRKDVLRRIGSAVAAEAPVIWMHCASLGEFEQGRPILEGIRKSHPDKKILLTFFSPSGYEVRKNYDGAHWVFYLPADTGKNAETFLDLTKPELAIFVKYEYWYHYLSGLQRRRIPTILVSGIFRKNKAFFKWYGNLYRKMLHCFSHLFVQDAESRDLLLPLLPPEKIELAGDTRFDRVVEIASAFQPVKTIEKMITGKQVLVAGSTWPDDEKNLKKIYQKLDKKIMLIIAPHEINESHIQFLLTLFPEAALYSDLLEEKSHNKQYNVIIINNIGLLSKLYYYSTICYIGGGFNTSGIHNTLEAAVYGKPVIFGPNYQKFAEAIGLIKKGGAFSYNTDNELFIILNNLLEHRDAQNMAGGAAGSYVMKGRGATVCILEWIRKNVF